MMLGLARGLTGRRRRRAASALTGTYRDNVTVSTRTGVASDMQISDTPDTYERTTALPTSIEFDGTDVTCVLGGNTTIGAGGGLNVETTTSYSYNAGTGAVTFSGTCGEWTIAFSGTYTLGTTTLAGTLTITGASRSTEEQLAFSSANPSGTAVTLGTAWYVDSVAGDDGNAGTGPDVPCKTLAGIATAGYAAGAQLRLAKGSIFREAIDHSGSVVNAKIQPYGVGPRPVVTAFDSTLASDWSNVAGGLYLNAGFAPTDDPASNGALLVLANGTALAGVADTATCQATPGSYVMTATSGAGTYNVYVHLADSGAPADGEVEITSRLKAIATSGDATATIIGIEARGAISEDGCITGAGSAIDVVSKWGHVHNVLWSNGTFDGAVLFAGEVANTSRVLVVHYAADGAGRDVETRGAIIGHPDFPDAAAGILAHHGAGAGFDSEALRNCGIAHTDGYAVSFGSDAGAAVTIANCILERGTGTQGVLLNNGAVVDIDDCRLYSHQTGYGWARNITAGTCTITIDDSIFTSSSGRGVYLNGSVTLTRCVFAVENGAGTVYHAEDAGAAALLNTSYCVYNGGAGDYGPRLNNAGADWATSDHDVADSPGLTFQANTVTGASNWATLVAAESFTNAATTAPTYQSEADADRPIYDETAASESSRGFAAGPDVTWTLAGQSADYAGWMAIVDAM